MRLARIGDDYYNLDHLVSVRRKPEYVELTFLVGTPVKLGLDNWEDLRPKLNVELVVENNYKSPRPRAVSF